MGNDFEITPHLYLCHVCAKTYGIIQNILREWHKIGTRHIAADIEIDEVL